MADATPVAPRVTIERIYLRDASFESPKAPAVFASEWNPKVQVNINTRTSRLDDTRYEVVMTLTLEARLGSNSAMDGAKNNEEENHMAMIVELQQAGVFRLEGMDEAMREQVLATTCPATLFPYARETVDSLVVKGAFPPFMLAPMNFDALYAEAKRRHAAEQGRHGDERFTH